MTEDDYGRNDPDERDPGAIDLEKELAGMDLTALLERGRKKQIVDLIAKIEMGMASHQEQTIFLNILKHNGITLSSPAPDGAAEEDAARKAADLPEFPEEGE